MKLYNVTQVEIAARVSVDIEKRPKTVTSRITYPNSCSLKYDGIDLKLPEMLTASGIALSAPAFSIEYLV